MNGFVCGVFGSNVEQKALFENSIAKKSEVEGIIVYHRNESGVRYSLLDDSQFPEKIQGYSRIASISDYAFYIVPPDGKLKAPDGELAVLLDAFHLSGRIVAQDSSSSLVMASIQSSLRGLSLERFPIEERDSKSSIVDISGIGPSPNFAKEGTMIYVDRAFSVKGVGVVVLGFILSGKVSVHDRLRLIPTTGETKYAEVKGIQVSDEDYGESGRGIRVGLSLKNVELKDLVKVSWLDDGSFRISNKVELKFNKSMYYKQGVIDRELHMQMPGPLILGKISKGAKDDDIVTTLQTEVPLWQGMRMCIIDLNAKSLRVAGSGLVSF